MLSISKIFFTVTLLFSSVLSENSKLNPFLLNFQQNDYKINYERIEIVSYNKEYLHDATVHTFKYNRTCTAFNASVTFAADMGKEFEIIFQAYKFASNEYRLFPMRFQVNFCDGLSANVMGIATVSKCGNIGCPVKKGDKYTACNFTPDPSKFPPLIPSGKYMFQMQGIYRSVEVLVAKGYVEVYRPFTGKYEK